MFPGPRTTSSTGQPLNRLAEIAEAVAFQNRLENHVARDTSNPFNYRMSPFPRPSMTVMKTALRKRQGDAAASLSTSLPASKRQKVDAAFATIGNTSNQASSEGEDNQDVRFREYQAEIWSEKFEDLCDFRRQFGHCHVPHTYTDNAPLAQWVKRQRYQYKLKSEGKRSTLSDERVKLLNQIGFIWNSHDVVWEERWQELLEFKRRHGHCIVPSNYERNPQLAVWVKRQRRQFKSFQDKKPSSMTPERIAKLKKLGFAWDCRKNVCSDSSEASHQITPNTTQMSLPKSVAPTLATFPATASVYDTTAGSLNPAALFSSQGFPFPNQVSNGNGSPSIAAFKKQQRHQFQPLSKIGAATSSFMEETSLGPSTESDRPSNVKTNDLSKLPCEFLSFSNRKFTKFPGIHVSK